MGSRFLLAEPTHGATQARPAADPRWLGPSRGTRQQRDRARRTRRTGGACSDYPHTLVETHGEHVGLPDGQMGNSEVGHMNIGSGRVVYQDLTRIDAAIADGSFFDNAALAGACDAASTLAARCTCSACSSGWRAQPRRPHLRDARSRARRGRGAHRRACVPRRPRHAAAKRARVAGEARSEMRAIRARSSPASAVATSRWIATSAGTASSSLTMRSQTPNRRSTPRTRSPRSIAPTHATRTTNSSSRPSSATARRFADGDAVVFMNFRADRARELSHAFVDADVRRIPACARDHIVGVRDPTITEPNSR